MSDPTAGFVDVQISAPNVDQAQRIATALVEERLAACVQITGPGLSIYRWRGKIEDDEEFYLTAKSRADLLPAIAQRVAELHSYDCPEVVATPIVGGSKAYLAWLAEQLRGS